MSDEHLTDIEIDHDVEEAHSESLSAAEMMRDRRIWRWLVLGGAVVLVAFLALFWPVMRGRLEAAKQLDQSQAQLSQADNIVDAIDKKVSAQLSPEASADASESLSAQILVARRELMLAKSLISDAMPHLVEEEQRRAEFVTTAATARLAMIDRAPTILVASAKAVRAKTLADRASTLAKAASADETRAVESFGLGTAAGMESVLVSANRAGGSQGDSKVVLAGAATAFPDAHLERYAALAEKRVKSLASLKAAAAVWLAGDKAGAAAAFATYRSLRAQADAAAAKLPASPAVATGQAYRKVAGVATDAYLKARKQAIQAEEALKS